MKSSIYVKRQSFEVREFSVIFCQPSILRNSVRDVTDIFAKSWKTSLVFLE